METKFKVGDKVVVKSREWYLANRNNDDTKWVNLPNGSVFGLARAKLCGEIVTIDKIGIDSCNDIYYTLLEDEFGMQWDDYMFEDKAIEVISDYQRGYNDAIDKICTWLRSGNNVNDSIRYEEWGISFEGFQDNKAVFTEKGIENLRKFMEE